MKMLRQFRNNLIVIVLAYGLAFGIYAIDSAKATNAVAIPDAGSAMLNDRIDSLQSQITAIGVVNSGQQSSLAFTFPVHNDANVVSVLDANAATKGLFTGTYAGTALVNATGTAPTTIGNESSQTRLNGVQDINFANDTNLCITTIAVSNAEIKTLLTSPKVIVAQPGAHRTVEIISAVLIHDYNVAQFDANSETLGLYYTNNTGLLLTSTVTQTLLLGTASADRIAKLSAATPNPTGSAATEYENKAVVLTSSKGDPISATATGVMRVVVSYRIHNTGL